LKKLFILILLAFLIAGAGEKCRTEGVDENTVSVSVQTGAQASTKWTIFCDTEHGRVSETFYYVIASRGEYVVYVQYKEGEYSIIVQNMFDRTAYCKAYPLYDCAPIASDVVLEGRITGDSVTVAYLTGTDFTETERIIDLP